VHFIFDLLSSVKLLSAQITRVTLLTSKKLKYKRKQTYAQPQLFTKDEVTIRAKGNYIAHPS
jgi:hypothetical protein